MKILITGAAGFIGSHLVDRLLLKNYHIIGIDNLITGTINNLAHLVHNSNFSFEIGDVKNYLNYNVDMVFNFASPASPEYYENHPVSTFNTNVLGAQQLVDLSRRCGCVIVQMSSSEIYGDPLIHPQDENYWGNVNPIGIRACYKEAKRATETILMDAKRVYGTDIRIIRIFNTYGPRMKNNDGRVISNFITQAINNKPITIYGDGLQTRSFCYIDDLIDGIIGVAELKELDGPINLGNPHEISINHLALHIKNILKSESSIIYKSISEDDSKRRCPDITKANNLIGFGPKIGLGIGIRKTAEYFKNAPFRFSNKDSVWQQG